MEKERIKLLWDFRGPNCLKTAEHHAIHLSEFADKEDLKNTLTGVDILSDMHAIAYLVVDKSFMIEVRDALKPHRGQLYTSA